MSEIVSLLQEHSIRLAHGDVRFVVTDNNTDESLYGVFPADARLHKKTGRFIVSKHAPTIDLLRDRYDEITDPQTLEDLYIHAGAIDCYDLEMVKRNEDCLDTLGAHLASPDSVSARILDFSQQGLQNTLLLYLREELSPQIERINGLRYVAGQLFQTDDAKYSIVPEAMQRRLTERFTFKEQRFVRVARGFTRSIDQARESFADTVPLEEVAFAFPMTPSEVEITDYIIGGR